MRAVDPRLGRQVFERDPQAAPAFQRVLVRWREPAAECLDDDVRGIERAGKRVSQPAQPDAVVRLVLPLGVNAGENPGEAPEIVLTSSHERADFGSLVENSGARGFVSKADLSAAALEALLR